jgi:hypothetical protein
VKDRFTTIKSSFQNLTRDPTPLHSNFLVLCCSNKKTLSIEFGSINSLWEEDPQNFASFHMKLYGLETGRGIGRSAYIVWVRFPSSPSIRYA